MPKSSGAGGWRIAWAGWSKPWILGLLSLALALRTMALVVAAWPFTVDDTFITLRYAKHLATGQGLVWNLGEPPVEGYSNFTFVLLGAVAYALGLDPVLSLKIVGVLALVLNALLIYTLARFWVGLVPALCPVALYLSLFGPVWWSVSGLETLTYVALVLAAVAAAFRGLGFRPAPAGRSAGTSTTWLVVSGGLVCLAAMTHPEGPLIGLAIAAGISTDRRQLRPLGIFVAAAGIPYAGYFAWRALHFQRLLPNPVYCKGGYDGDPFTLVEDLAIHAGPFLLALAVAGWRRLDARHVMTIVLLLLYLGALFGVDPILTQGSRLSLAPQALLISVACGSLLARVRTPYAEGLAIGSLVLSSLLVVHLPAELRTKALSYQRRTEARLEIGRWIDETTSAGDSYVMGDAGAVTYATERRMLDAYCLNSQVMTRPPIHRSGARYAQWLLEQEPAVIVVPSYSPDSLLLHRYMGVFPALAADSQFGRDYEHARTVNVPGTIFHYWLYRRK